MSEGSAFAQAATMAAQQGNTTAPADRTESRLIDNPQDTSSIEARLFGGEKLPSIFTKKHGVGDKVTGIIKDLPFEIQSRTFNAEGPGKPRYWMQDGKPTEDSRDAGTGKPNRPIMDIVIPLSTEYRFSAAELELRGEDEDDGSRGLYLSSEDLKAYRAAIRAAKLNSISQLPSMRVTMWRSGQKPTGKGNPAWLYQCVIERSA